MKPRYLFILFSFITLVFSGCALVPLSLNGDSDKGLKQILSGKWVSLDGIKQITFDDTGGITEYFSMSSNKGNYSMTSNLMVIEDKQIYNGSAWVDITGSSGSSQVYHIFSNQKKMILSPVCNVKISGSLNPTSMDGKYLAYYESSMKTSASSPVYIRKINITTEIALDTIISHSTIKQNYTMSGPDYVSVPEYVLMNFDVQMNVFWKDGGYTINRQITNYHTINGTSLEFSLTNNIFSDQTFFINGTPSEGVSLLFGSSVFYSNQVFEKK